VFLSAVRKKQSHGDRTGSKNPTAGSRALGAARGYGAEQSPAASLRGAAEALGEASVRRVAFVGCLARRGWLENKQYSGSYWEADERIRTADPFTIRGAQGRRIELTRVRQSHRPSSRGRTPSALSSRGSVGRSMKLGPCPKTRTNQSGRIVGSPISSQP